MRGKMALALVGALLLFATAAGAFDIAQTEQLMEAFTGVINTSTERPSLLAALGMLRDAAWEPSLPAARRLALTSDDADVRHGALQLLGWHGAARDWEILVIGLYSDDEGDVLAAVRAVEQYGDERGLDHLADLAEYDARPAVSAAAAEGRARLVEFLAAMAGPMARELGVADLPQLRASLMSARVSGDEDARERADAIATTMRLVMRRAAAEADP